MKRREFIFLLGSASMMPGGALAQAQVRRPLIAVLSGLSLERAFALRTGFVPRLQELGYALGRDIDVVYKYADGDDARIPSLVNELVQLKPDVMVASHGQVALAMRQATTSTPIVSAIIGNQANPALGLVEGNARPQGNVTGILNHVEGLVGKVVALASEVIPRAAKMGALYHRGFRQHELDLAGVKAAASAMAMEIVPVPVGGAADLDGAFQTMASERVDGVFVFAHSLFLNERERIAKRAVEKRLPTMHVFREHVEAGGLISYGIDTRGNYRRAADFVDKILKGTKVNDLPVELPTEFRLAINLRTAKALGIVIAEAFLVRADEVIE